MQDTFFEEELRVLEMFCESVKADPRDFFWTSERAEKFLVLITKYRDQSKDIHRLLGGLEEIKKNRITASIEVDHDAKKLALDSLRLIGELVDQLTEELGKKYKDT